MERRIQVGDESEPESGEVVVGPSPSGQEAGMANVDERSERAERVEGNGAANTITVRSPATAAFLGHVPNLGADEVAELARRGRAAQPGWEALGFEGRGKVLRRAQKWLVDNQERVIDTICAETGKAYEDALIAEVLYGQAAFGFWAKMAPKYLADEKV